MDDYPFKHDELHTIDSEADFERLELEDQAETVGFLTPREYGKLRKIAPQLVYYYIRNKVIETEVCKCGRKIINVNETDRILSERRKEKKNG